MLPTPCRAPDGSEIAREITREISLGHTGASLEIQPHQQFTGLPQPHFMALGVA
jgi:hypothetical protein